MDVEGVYLDADAILEKVNALVASPLLKDNGDVIQEAVNLLAVGTLFTKWMEANPEPLREWYRRVIADLSPRLEADHTDPL